jgi:single-stranded DNA-binding protein
MVNRVILIGNLTKDAESLPSSGNRIMLYCSHGPYAPRR